MSENVIADYLNAPGHRASFHQGDNLQFVPQPPDGGESTEADEAALEADRRLIHAPRAIPRFGVDEDGNPIEVPPGGLVFNAETGTVEIPEEEAPVDEPAPAPAAAPAPTTTTSTRSTSTSSTTPTTTTGA